MAKILMLNPTGQKVENNILTLPDYIQQTVPVNPSDNETWVERQSSGEIINIWRWDAINNRWLGLQSKFLGIQHSATASGNSAISAIDYFLQDGNSILLESLLLKGSSELDYDNSIRYTVSFNKLSNASATQTSIQTFDLTSFKSNVFTVLYVFFNNNVISDASQFNISVTRFNNASPLRITVQAGYRIIR